MAHEYKKNLSTFIEGDTVKVEVREGADYAIITAKSESDGDKTILHMEPVHLVKFARALLKAADEATE